MSNQDTRYITPPKTPMISIYTTIVVTLPIISIYASGIEGFTLGDIVLALVFFVCIINLMTSKKFEVGKSAKLLFLLIDVIIITSIISILIQNIFSINMLVPVSTNEIAIRTIRRSFYYALVPLVSSKWFDYQQAKKQIQVLGVLGTLFIGLQYILYYGFSYILNGYLKFLPLYHENYMTQDYVARYSTIFRPTGYLLEPAHMSRYMLIALVLFLFDKRDDYKSASRSMKYSFIVTLGICLTTSGIGIMIAVVVWIVRVLTLLFARQHKITVNMIGIAILIIIAFIFLFQSDIVQMALLRVENSDLANVNTAGGARFRGFVQYFNLPALFKIFGMGYGSTPNTNIVTWFSGASYILFGTGIIGFTICGYIFVKLFFMEKTSTGRVLIVVWGLLFAMDDSFMSHVAVVYFSFICFSNCSTKDKRKISCEK